MNLPKINFSLLRNFLFPIITFFCFYIFINYTKADSFNKKEVLSTLISVISIIIAIIVTYLFSKLFAEKAVKIERKKEIDLLSSKVTSLRKIAFHIRGMFNFWKFNNVNIKSILDHKYKDLTYEEYRGYDLPGHRKFSYDEYSKISKEIYGTDGQAYLALKGLEDGENSFTFFSRFNPKNYSLDDISRYKEYSGSFWNFLDRSDDNIVSFHSEKRYFLSKVDEEYYNIIGKQINYEEYKKDIKDMFSEFDSVIFEKHFYLNSLNYASSSKTFISSLINMVVFLILLILSVFVFVIDFNNIDTVAISVLILSFFVSNTIDLILLTIQSIKSELSINEVFNI